MKLHISSVLFFLGPELSASSSSYMEFIWLFAELVLAEKLKTSSKIEFGFRLKPNEVKRLSMFLIHIVFPIPDEPVLVEKYDRKKKILLKFSNKN